MTLLATRTSLRLLLAVGALAFWGCAQLWPPLDPNYKQPETVDTSSEVEKQPETSEVVLAQTLEERYPLVRFVRHGDDTVSAFLTVPQGYGTAMTDPAGALITHCACFHRTEQPASLELVPSGGQVYSGDAKLPPWQSAGTMMPIEDVLLARGTENDLEEIFRFVDLYYNGGPQIEIQAQIVEVTGSSLFERGVVPIDGATPIFSNLGGTQPTGEGPFLRNIGGGFSTGTGQNLGGTSGSGTVLQLAAIQSDIQFNAFLQFLRTQEDVDFVSQPSVVTRNGVAANLTSSEQFPYLKPTAVAATGVTQFTIDYRDVGVKLHVLPFLVGGEHVHMTIEAEASRIGRSILLGQDSAGNDVFSPTFTVRRATTAVVVKSGEHVVIGGLTLKEAREIESKFPILGDLPLLEYAFSSYSTEEVETEVIFIITPIVTTRAANIAAPLGDIFNPFGD